MFSNKLKRPALALAVTAGLLAVAELASAGTTNEPKGGPPTNATPWIIVYDFEGEAVHQMPRGGSVVAGPTGPKAGPNEVLMESIVSSAGADSTPQARSAVLPELDANANAFMPNVDDEVLAGVNYEPDYIEGTQ